MRTLGALIVLTLVCALTSVSGAAERDEELGRTMLADGRYAGALTGEVVSRGKAIPDTVYIYGGPGSLEGKFQDASGTPDDQDWTSIDWTARTEVIWHCDDYNAELLDPLTVPNHAWWVGIDTWVDDCGTGDFNGYGNGWLEYLDWMGAVPNNALPTTVTMEAVINYDNEPGYDYLKFSHETATGMVEDAVYNGDNRDPLPPNDFVPVEVSLSFSVTPADYVGSGGDEVHLRWWFVSDGGWSDEDCLWPTMGGGQVDLIDVFFDQGGGPVQQGVTEDCEGGPEQWFITFPVGVGDFAKVWPLLNDIDPCRGNTSPCFAFIDDGIVVPGTGGYLCTTWCYGPGGYITNPEGGLAGPEFHIDNKIWSPVVAWPGEEYTGAAFEFDVYHHEPLSSVSPGIFYQWMVRSTSSMDPADIEDAGFMDRSFVYYADGTWIQKNRTARDGQHVVTDLMTPGRTYVQMSLSAYEVGWVWGYVGTDGGPGPYFDNVRFLCWEFTGPGVATQGEIRIAQDNFPEIGAYDFGDLAANSIRFDMATDISLGSDPWATPGDSIWIDVVPVRSGSVLNDRPKLFYKLFPNPLFDPIRTFPNQGWIYGDTTYTSSGSIIGDRYNFDLPDTGFFFPGDVIHYYIEGQDNVSGDIGTTLLPGDTTGFSGPANWPTYDSTFRVQGLPTFNTLTAGDHPKVLFWNDFASRGGENEWYYALNNNGYQPGVDFDVYYTNGPSSGIGNGIGGRATATQLNGYETILYTCGDLGAFTISNGDFQNDSGDDRAVLDGWLRQGGGSVVRNMFLTGDDLVYDLTQNAGSQTAQFVANWIGVTWVDQDVRPLIDNQATPLAQPLAGNSLNLSLDSWICYGGCLRFNDFDAVTTAGTTEKVAEFLDPNGASGQYEYAAMTYHIEPEFNARVVYCPYDLMFVYTDPDNPPLPPGTPMAARSVLLNDVLLFFGHIGTSQETSVPDAGVFTVKNYPNPFNPATKIEFNMPRRGELTIKIYNVRGELVKTLIDEVRPQGADFAMWDGTDRAGQAVASGIYFYTAQAFGDETIGKMTLVR